ncbi:MAG: threonine synthase, partial [Pseudohongiellaceae bacterium]
QRRQMTTVRGDNINNLAVEGNFDDCQKIVKQAFSDQSFLPDNYQLVAVNSINWARIMAQIVYYFYAGLKVMDDQEGVSFSVPTGNFGDIYAGYLAKKMGLPVKQLVIATNRNDILHRFISRNQYSLAPLEHSLSPSMDIMVSSNFERFLFDLFEGDGEQVREFVTGLGEKELHVSRQQWNTARSVFDSFSVDDEMTCATIREIFADYDFLIDPHTATGVKAARECNRHAELPMVILATAHPAKFAEAIAKAGLKTPELPAHLGDLHDREEHYTVLPNSLGQVKEFIRKRLDAKTAGKP